MLKKLIISLYLVICYICLKKNLRLLLCLFQVTFGQENQLETKNVEWKMQLKMEWLLVPKQCSYIQYLPHSQEMGQVEPGLLNEQVLQDNDRNNGTKHLYCKTQYLLIMMHCGSLCMHAESCESPELCRFVHSFPISGQFC